MTYQERLKEVEKILQSGEKYNLEFLATYLLESEDVEKDKKQQYNFYTDEEKFRKRQNENVGSEVLDFLESKAFSKKHIIPKKQIITKNDKLKPVISDYETFIQVSNKIKLNKEVKADQKISKDKLNGTIYFKHVEVGSTETDYFLFNFTDKEHIVALLKCKGENLSKWISCLIYDLNKLLDEIEWTNRQKQILDLWSEDYASTQEEIGELLGIGQRAVSEHLDVIASKIVEQYKKNYMDWIYTEKIKGQYKKCSKCNEVKLLSEFGKDKRNIYGFKSICKRCDNLHKK